MVPLALPAYNPELNPAEHIVRVLHRCLANQIFETLDDLQEALVAELAWFWAQPEVLIRLTGCSWWIEGLLSL